MKWENSNDPDVLAAARTEIDRCFPAGPPPILDPFAGGGAIPLEAQRLGLKALAGDLNPVAVLINKAMIEIPPRFAGRPPVHPDIESTLTTWDRAQGLAADVEAYGRWMRDEAERRIGHLYPDAMGPGGEKLTPIAWIWARTVESPDPAWSGHVPLVASWTLASRPGKPKVWIEPVIDRSAQTIAYEIRRGSKPTHERTIERGHATCVATGSAIPGDYIKAQSRAGLMRERMLAVVAEGDRGRLYCAPSDTDERSALAEEPLWKPEGRNPEKLTGGTVYVYGLDEWQKLFSTRQLVALTTFSDLLSAVREQILEDAVSAGLADDGRRLRDGGSGATAYADALATYLAFAVDRLADRSSTICTWDSGYVKIRNTFGRQAIPMTWDFAEGNPFSSSTGSWEGMVRWVRKALEHVPASVPGEAVQRDARDRVRECALAAVSTDPPYYDNISYADLSDFFFVWLRRNLSDVWPDECATLLTPKAEELIANRYRAGSKQQAEEHFESGMAEFMAEVAHRQPADVPATIYYAYKATETKDGGDPHDGVGHIPPSRSRRWAAGERHVANAHGTRKPVAGIEEQRAGVVDRARVPPAACVGFARHSGRVHCGTKGGTARGSASPSVRQHRPGRYGSVHDRARHEGVLPLRQGRGGRRLGHVGLLCTGDHQRRVRRNPRRGGG